MEIASGFPFVPGFLAALERAPDARLAIDRLWHAARIGGLSRRARAMIALTVAQQSGFDYCIWAQTCAARAAGLTGEDIALACAGSALDRHDAALTRVARAIAGAGAFSEHEIREMPQDPVLTRDEMLVVAACAGAALIENCLLQGIAPAGASEASTRR